MIDKKNIEDIRIYCEANDIENINELINKMLMRGFTIEKYGEIPKKTQEVPTVIEKEVIKEVPVETIKYVDKIINVTNNDEIDKLVSQIEIMKVNHNKVVNKLNHDNESLNEKIKQIEKEYLKNLADKDNEINKLKSSKDFYGE